MLEVVVVVVVDVVEVVDVVVVGVPMVTVPPVKSTATALALRSAHRPWSILMVIVVSVTPEFTVKWRVVSRMPVA